MRPLLKWGNDREAPKALELRGLHIELSEASYALAAILHGGKKDYCQYQARRNEIDIGGAASEAS